MSNKGTLRKDADSFYIGTASNPPVVPSMNTATRDALSAVNGMIIYNSQTAKLEAYSNSAWREVGDIT
jgi:hypothetical protein